MPTHPLTVPHVYISDALTIGQPSSMTAINNGRLDYVVVCLQKHDKSDILQWVMAPHDTFHERTSPDVCLTRRLRKGNQNFLNLDHARLGL